MLLRTAVAIGCLHSYRVLVRTLLLARCGWWTLFGPWRETNYLKGKRIGDEGFCSGGKRSIQLSYGRPPSILFLSGTGGQCGIPEMLLRAMRTAPSGTGSVAKGSEASGGAVSTRAVTRPSSAFVWPRTKNSTLTSR